MPENLVGKMDSFFRNGDKVLASAVAAMNSEMDAIDCAQGDELNATLDERAERIRKVLAELAHRLPAAAQPQRRPAPQHRKQARQSRAERNRAVVVAFQGVARPLEAPLPVIRPSLICVPMPDSLLPARRSPQRSAPRALATPSRPPPMPLKSRAVARVGRRNIGSRSNQPIQRSLISPEPRMYMRGFFLDWSIPWHVRSKVGAMQG